MGRDPVKFEVMAKDPQFMRDAMQQAKLEEDKTYVIKESTRRNFTGSFNTFPQVTGPQRVGQSNAESTLGSGGNSTAPVKKLTYQEIKERRQRALCFSCDD